MTHQHVLNTNTTSSYSFFSFYPSPLKDITITTNHSLTHIMYVLMNDSLLWWCLLVYGMCVGHSLCWVSETSFTGNLTGKQSSSLLTYDDAGGVDLCVHKTGMSKPGWGTGTRGRSQLWCPDIWCPAHQITTWADTQTWGMNLLSVIQRK